MLNPVDAELIERDYAKRKEGYSKLADEIVHSLAERIKVSGLKIASIEKRVKPIGSILAKAKRKEQPKPLDAFVDIVGTRVIVLLASDMKRVDKIIREEFDVVEVDLKTNASEGLGYQSDHYVCRIKSTYKGTRYDSIKGQKFEIQLRTLCMHAWAALSHHLEYKTTADVPTALHQSLNALSGLFYIADRQFEQFVNSRYEYQSGLAALAERTESGDLELNMDTLKAYFAERMANRAGVGDRAISELISELSGLGVKTIAEVQKVVEEQFKNVEWAEDVWWPHNSGKLNVAGVVRTAFRFVNAEYDQQRGHIVKLKLPRRDSDGTR